MTEILELVSRLAPDVADPTTQQIERRGARLITSILSEQLSQEVGTRSNSAGSAQASGRKDTESHPPRGDIEVVPLSHDTQTHRRMTKRSRGRKLRGGHRRSRLIACGVVAVVLIGASVFALQQGLGGNSRPRPTNKSVASLRWSLVSDLTAGWHTSPLNYYAMVFLTCPSTNVCFAEGLVGSEVALEVTHDGGASWQKLTPPAKGQPFTCVDASICAFLGNAAGGGPAGHEAFVETVDGGQSWSSLPFPGGAGYGALSCTTASVCVAIGSNHGLNTAMVTANGGHAWSQFELPSRLEPPAVSRNFVGFSPRGAPLLYRRHLHGSWRQKSGATRKREGPPISTVPACTARRRLGVGVGSAAARVQPRELLLRRRLALHDSRNVWD